MYAVTYVINRICIFSFIVIILLYLLFLKMRKYANYSTSLYLKRGILVIIATDLRLTMRKDQKNLCLPVLSIFYAPLCNIRDSHSHYFLLSPALLHILAFLSCNPLFVFFTRKAYFGLPQQQIVVM